MQTRLVIDAIVQQTTILIAQLATSAGMRAPLAHIANQTFVSLTRELERQGVAQKVVADMFGLALRSYQQKVQRLSESATDRGHTIWEARASEMSGLALALAALLVGACGKTTQDSAQSQTHWLAACNRDMDCGEFACICGRCVLSCEDAQACEETGMETTCHDEGSAAVAGLCGSTGPAPICLQPCDGDCPTGQNCVGGACVVDEVELASGETAGDGSGLVASSVSGVWIFHDEPMGGLDTHFSAPATIEGGCLLFGGNVVVWHVGHLDDVRALVADILAGEEPMVRIGGGGLSLDEGANLDDFPDVITDRCELEGLLYANADPIERFVPPQVIAAGLIALIESGDGARVVGEPGAVEPDSTIEVETLATGDVVETMASSDGSFDVTVSGDGAGVLAVVQRIDGLIAFEPVYLYPGRPAFDLSAHSPLACHERLQEIYAAQVAIEADVDRSCQADDQCALAHTRQRPCRTERLCPESGVPVAASAREQLEATQSDVAAQLCRAYEAGGCEPQPLAFPMCAPPSVIACVEGQCLDCSRSACDDSP